MKTTKRSNKSIIKVIHMTCTIHYISRLLKSTKLSKVKKQTEIEIFTSVNKYITNAHF